MNVTYVNSTKLYEKRDVMRFGRIIVLTKVLKYFILSIIYTGELEGFITKETEVLQIKQQKIKDRDSVPMD